MKDLNLGSCLFGLLPFLFSISIGYGQNDNLLQNGGFETYSSCPTSIGQLEKATPWRSLNTGTPEYYNTTCGFESGVAANGAGYTGLIIHGEYTEAIEYLTYSFDSLLPAGTYCFSIKLKARKGPFYTDEFGLALQKEVRYLNYWGRFKAKYQWKLDSVLTPSPKWKQIKTEIEIKEPFSFFVLGNFSGNDQPKTIRDPFANVKPGWDSYIYVDDVFFALKESESCSFQLENHLQLEPETKPFQTKSYSVFFDFDQYQINPKEVEKLNNYLKKNTLSKYAVKLEAHTDSIGSEAYNNQLAEKRANQVKKLLLNEGILSIGELVIHGEKKPSYKNNSALLRKQNRRVDIIPIKK